MQERKWIEIVCNDTMTNKPSIHIATSWQIIYRKKNLHKRKGKKQLVTLRKYIKNKYK